MVIEESTVKKNKSNQVYVMQLENNKNQKENKNNYKLKLKKPQYIDTVFSSFPIITPFRIDHPVHIYSFAYFLL